jgi:hypothetical protein
MKPNLIAGLESCLQRLTGYLADYTGQYLELAFYSGKKIKNILL